MSQYLTPETFRDAYGVMRREDFDDLVKRAGAVWVVTQFRIVSDRIDSLCEKRYATPFQQPYSDTVCGWAAALVLPVFALRMGFAPNDAAIEGSKLSWADLAASAEAQIKEAADAEKGLYQLPLRRDLRGDGVVHGTPLFYSEPGPYDWIDRQAEAIER